MFLPFCIGIIVNIVILKKLPVVLFNCGYEELSRKITMANNYKGGNNPKSEKWKNAQLNYQEFRHLKLAPEYKKLKNIQVFTKIFFILSICFCICLLLSGWGMGLSLLIATLTAILNNENIRLIVIISFFSFMINFVNITITIFVLKCRKYY